MGKPYSFRKYLHVDDKELFKKYLSDNKIKIKIYDGNGYADFGVYWFSRWHVISRSEKLLSIPGAATALLNAYESGKTLQEYLHDRRMEKINDGHKGVNT